MSVKRIQTPLDDATIVSLKSGERVLISGIIYTARDAAHKRMIELIERNEPLPIPLQGQVIYYAGPAPAPPGCVIGSIGPTTAGRMDSFTPELLAKGLKGMIGKGKRTPQVRQACQQEKAVYFAAVGGAAALMAQSVINCELLAWEELGPEAIYALTVRDLPVIVVNDCDGNDLYEQRSLPTGRSR